MPHQPPTHPHRRINTDFGKLSFCCRWKLGWALPRQRCLIVTSQQAPELDQPFACFNCSTSIGDEMFVCVQRFGFVTGCQIKLPYFRGNAIAEVECKVIDCKPRWIRHTESVTKRDARSFISPCMHRQDTFRTCEQRALLGEIRFR